MKPKSIDLGMVRHEKWLHRTVTALKALFGVMVVGAVGFYSIWIAFSPAPEAHSFLDAVYLTVITLATVGYADNMEFMLLPEPGRTVAVIFTIVYVLVAYGVVLWTSSTIVAYFVEGTLSDALFRRRHQRRATQMENHFILCGVGPTGIAIIQEFGKTGKPLVVVDRDRERIDQVEQEYRNGVVLLQGDETDEAILSQAGLPRAAGLICNLPSDPENLFLTITARTLNPKIRIVSSAMDPKSRDKMIRAGADSVVYPWQIGAMRLASEMIRPTVVSFLDRMLRDPKRQIRVSEVPVSGKAAFVGKSLQTSRIHEDYGLLVIAVHEVGKAENEFIYNPPGNHVIQAGSVFVVIGEVEQVDKLTHAAGN